MTSTSIFLLVVTFLALMWCYVLLKDVYYTGMNLGYIRFIDNYSQKKLDEVILTHKQAVRKFLLSLLMPVAFIEAIVLLEGGRWGDTELFQVHITFVGLFLLNLFLEFFIFTGLKNKRVHRFLFKSLIAFTSGMTGTGFWLIVQLFNK